MADAAARVTARIMGEDYVIRARASAEHVTEVAAKVDECMRRVAAADPRLSLRDAAVLTALNLADELHQADARQRQLVSLIETM